MNKKSFMFIPLVALLLGGCVGNKHYNPEDYFVEGNEWKRETYRVLTLGDIHFAQNDYFDDHFAVMQDTIDKADPDMIIVNGDAFTFATKQTVKILFNWLDTRVNQSGNAIRWSYVFGNHDDQGQYSEDYIPRLLAGEVKGTKYNNVAFVNLPDDDVTGRTNVVLNIRKDNDVVYQLYLFDSHSYNFTKYEGQYKKLGEDYYYDYIKEDQVEWYKRVATYSKEQFPGVKSSAYFHIPVPEFQFALDTLFDEEGNPISEKVLTGDGKELLVSGPQINTGLYAAMDEIGITQSITASHDHINNFVVKYQVEGGHEIYLTYGTHATDRIYYAKDKIGGQVMEVSSTGDLTFTNIFAANNYEGGR